MAENPFSFPAYMGPNPEPIQGPKTLDQRRFLFVFRWLPYPGPPNDGYWSLDTQDAQGVMLAPAVPVVVTGDLWANYRDDERIPPGLLEVVRISGTGDPGPSDLGVSVEVRYVT